MPPRTAEIPQKYGVRTPNRIDKVKEQTSATSLTDWRSALKNKAPGPLRSGVLEWAVPQGLWGLFRVGA